MGGQINHSNTKWTESHTDADGTEGRKGRRGAEAEVEADADGGVYMVGQTNPEAAETAEEEDLSH